MANLLEMLHLCYPCVVGKSRGAWAVSPLSLVGSGLWVVWLAVPAVNAFMHKMLHNPPLLTTAPHSVSLIVVFT